MQSNPVGRPAVWHQSIFDYVDGHGSARALEIRRALGIPKQSFYSAVATLVCQGRLCWKASDRGNYRFLKTIKNEFSHCPTSLLQLVD